MSIRSLVEINHDSTWKLDDPAFVAALTRYLASGDRLSAEALRPFGVTVVSTRHHSSDFWPGDFARRDGFGELLKAGADQA